MSVTAGQGVKTKVHFFGHKLNFLGELKRPSSKSPFNLPRVAEPTPCPRTSGAASGASVATQAKACGPCVRRAACPGRVGLWLTERRPQGTSLVSVSVTESVSLVLSRACLPPGAEM